MLLYPLKFKPIYKKRIWGGQRLKELFDKDIPPDTKIGESWELADLPNDKSVIANGPLAGQTISQAVEKYPEQITADKYFAPPFPLLIKLLDAQDILSVQVHPDIETCKKLGKGQPKTECWYIIAAEKNAFIYKGLKKGTTKEIFAKAIKRGNVTELLKKVEVKPGECHFLPAGTAHSIGPGLIIAEIQTPSDTTYRVFDFNRVDEFGKPRPLHIPEALQSINFEKSAQTLPITTDGTLVDSDQFKIDKNCHTKNSQMSLPGNKMSILIIITGTGSITASGTEPADFRAGDCILIPAAYQGNIKFKSDTEYLTVTI